MIDFYMHKMKASATDSKTETYRIQLAKQADLTFMEMFAANRSHHIRYCAADTFYTDRAHLLLYILSNKLVHCQR